MNQKKSLQFSDHGSFSQFPKAKTQSYFRNQKINKNTNNINNFENTGIPRTTSSPSIYNYSLRHSYDNAKKGNESPLFSKTNSINENEGNIYFQFPTQNTKEYFYNCENQPNNNISNTYCKRGSHSTIPINIKNKISLTKAHQMCIGFKKNKNNWKKIDVNGKKVCVGLGFPVKTPIICSSTSDLIKNSDKKYNDLENFIEKLKAESKISKNCIKNKIIDENKDSNKNNSSEKEKFKNDYIRVESEYNSANENLINMESIIINELTDINTSINQLIEERKEIQKQHRIWLQYMKKKSNLIAKQTNFKKVNRSFSVDLL